MKNERLKKAGFVLWVFVHLLLLMFGSLNRGKRDFGYAHDVFYPWSYHKLFEDMKGLALPINWKIKYYDITEFVIYVITPIFLYYLYRYVKGDKIPFIK